MVSVLALEASGRRFESCHPYQASRKASFLFDRFWLIKKRGWKVARMVASGFEPRATVTRESSILLSSATRSSLMEKYLVVTRKIEVRFLTMRPVPVAQR